MESKYYWGVIVRLFLDKIKFGKWVHVAPLFAVGISFLIRDRILRGFILIAGAVIGIIGIKYKYDK